MILCCKILKVFRAKKRKYFKDVIDDNNTLQNIQTNLFKTVCIFHGWSVLIYVNNSNIPHSCL